MKTIAKYAFFFQLICFLFFLTIGGIYCQQVSVRKDGILAFLKDDGSLIVSVNVEIADTSQSRISGLMFRELKDFSSGVLFLYEEAKYRSFWMRDTPGSLDIIFIGEDLKIINIAQKTAPMSDTSYLSRSPAKYVVEVKGGFSGKYGVKAGDKISWQRF